MKFDILYDIEPSENVLCDICGGNYTDSSAIGGLQMGSYAICPTCAPGIERSAEQSGELNAIKARCPDGMSFANWVRETLR